MDSTSRSLARARIMKLKGQQKRPSNVDSPRPPVPAVGQAPTGLQLSATKIKNLKKVLSEQVEMGWSKSNNNNNNNNNNDALYTALDALGPVQLTKSVQRKLIRQMKSSPYCQPEEHRKAPSYISCGVMFGRLIPIPTDLKIDPKLRHCFNCWKFGHKHRQCNQPVIFNFCRNCGRRGETLESCPRCGPVYNDIRRNWSNDCSVASSSTDVWMSQPPVQQNVERNEGISIADTLRLLDALRDVSCDTREIVLKAVFTDSPAFFSAFSY